MDKKTNNNFHEEAAIKITQQDFIKIKNIIDDNQKIYNIQRTIGTITSDVEYFLVKLGNLLLDLNQVHIDVKKIQSRIDEKFDLLNDKFELFLDEIVRNNDLNTIENIFLQEKFQDKLMKKVISRKR